MTDNDIIKALECCSKAKCKEGPYDKDEKVDIFDITCIINMAKDALDLINRQKAEIEEKSNKLREVLPIVAELKAEAITEFAERLKAHYPHSPSVCNTIDKVAKEMKGY
jgi:hypothetical protein